MKNTCGNCAAWDHMSTSASHGRRGFCRLKPPLAREEVRSILPVTHDREWCLEFVAKPAGSMDYMTRVMNGDEA